MDVTLKLDPAIVRGIVDLAMEQRTTNNLLRILINRQGNILMAINDAVARVEAANTNLAALKDAFVTKADEVVTTLRELAALARAGLSLAELETRLNAAADGLEGTIATIATKKDEVAAVETEVDPTPDGGGEPLPENPPA